MLEEERNPQQIKPFFCSAGHVCSVVLEELERGGIKITLKEFLGAWNKYIGGSWYAKVRKTELEEEVHVLALDMLTHLLVHEFKVSERVYYKIIREVYPESITN